MKYVYPGVVRGGKVYRVERRRRKRKSLDELAAESTKRQPPSGVLLELPNPSVKAVMYLGAPVKQQRFRAKTDLCEYKCRRCTFDLPSDWRLVDEPVRCDHAGSCQIVARQDGEDRCVEIRWHADEDVRALGRSEVLR